MDGVCRLFYLIHKRLPCTQEGRSRFHGRCHMGLTLDQTRRCNSPGNLHHRYQLGKLWEKEREEEEEERTRERKRKERKRRERKTNGGSENGATMPVID